MLAQSAAEKQGREKTSGGQKTAFARGPESLPKYLQRFSLRGVHYGNSGPLSIGQKDNVSNDTQGVVALAKNIHAFNRKGFTASICSIIPPALDFMH